MFKCRLRTNYKCDIIEINLFNLYLSLIDLLIHLLVEFWEISSLLIEGIMVSFLYIIIYSYIFTMYIVINITCYWLSI